MSSYISTSLQEIGGNTDALLGKLDATMRGPGLVAALKKSLQPVKRSAKRHCPKGGPRIGTKAGKKHLADTIVDKVVDYGETKVGMVGPQWSAGAHGHNVEFGHAEVLWGTRTGRRVPPHPFLRPAAEETKAEQVSVFTAALTKLAEEASK